MVVSHHFKTNEASVEFKCCISTLRDPNDMNYCHENTWWQLAIKTRCCLNNHFCFLLTRLELFLSTFQWSVFGVNWKDNHIQPHHVSKNFRPTVRWQEIRCYLDRFDLWAGKLTCYGRTGVVGREKLRCWRGKFRKKKWFTIEKSLTQNVNNTLPYIWLRSVHCLLIIWY